MRYTAVLTMMMSLLVLGCDRSHDSYQDFMTHPDKMIAALKQCQTMSQETASHSVECITAANAYRDTVSLQKELLSDPQAFGVKILQAQYSLAQLKADDEQALPATKTQTFATWQAQQALVDRYLAISKESGE